MQPDYCCYFHINALEETGMGFPRNGPSLFFLCKNSGNSEGDDRPPGRIMRKTKSLSPFRHLHGVREPRDAVSGTGRKR